LAVDSDLDIASTFVKEWAERNIKMERVDTMPEAIQKLLHYEYIFVGINGEVTNFMPFLLEMRSATNIPIMIAVNMNNFDADKQVAALKNGADLYAPWHFTPSGNVSAVLAQIERINATKKAPQQFYFHNELLLSVAYRTVYIGTIKVNLTRQEFDMLHFLMMNHGKPLRYSQIYKQVWKGNYDEVSPEVLRNAIKRLRGSLGTAPDGSAYIENIHDFGYRFPHENNK